jgi:predicted CoA-substrate-specific enzyme activase
MVYYLGIDVGSISTKLAVLDAKAQLITFTCFPTGGEPLAAVKSGLQQIIAQQPDASFAGIAVTGSARELVARMVNAGVVKNEITAQARATRYYFPDAKTIIEIGGQDSKIIILRDGLVVDFGMNTVCAAGTGSFLDHQARRLSLTTAELGELASCSQAPEPITGRCTVFAESDMIHRQQSGAKTEDIVYGLCKTLAQNYLTSVAAGKDIQPPVVMQGGLALNRGMVRAFEEELGYRITIPEHPELMGAIGVALLALDGANSKS